MSRGMFAHTLPEITITSEAILGSGWVTLNFRVGESTVLCSYHLNMAQAAQYCKLKQLAYNL